MVATIMHPETFLDAVAEGTVSPEMVQAFRTVYPKLYETLVLRIREEVGASKQRLPRERRKVLAVLMGPEGVNPQSLFRSQQVYAEAQPPEEQQAAGKGVSGISIRGLDKLHNLKDSRHSGMQRLEMRA